MEAFSWKRDLNIVDWRATILHNLLRAACAGIVVSIIMLFFVPEVGVGSALLYVLIWPIGYLIFMLPMGLVAGFLSRVGVPFVGLLSIAFSLAIAIGDPLVWMLKRTKPEIVPVDKPGFFEFSVIVFVIDEEKKRALQEKAVGAISEAVPDRIGELMRKRVSNTTESPQEMIPPEQNAASDDAATEEMTPD